jgi:hypothetical protein
MQDQNTLRWVFYIFFCFLIDEQLNVSFFRIIRIKYYATCPNFYLLSYLLVHQLRDHYKEILLQITIIFLGEISSGGISSWKPGALNKTRRMAHECLQNVSCDALIHEPLVVLSYLCSDLSPFQQRLRGICSSIKKQKNM